MSAYEGRSTTWTTPTREEDFLDNIYDDGDRYVNAYGNTGSGRSMNSVRLRKTNCS